MTLDYFNKQKIRFFLFLITIIISKDAFSQNDNPCDKSWSEWKTVWSSPSGKVEYQLQFFSNGKCSCGLASNYVRIRHTLPHRAYVEISLEGKDCDDKFMVTSFGAETTNGEISNDKGDWHTFKSISGVEKVLIEYMDGEKKIKIITTRAGTKRYINSIPEEEYNKQQQQKASGSSGSPTNRSGSNKVVPGTALPAIVFPGDETTNSSSNNKNKNQSTSSVSVSQKQAQLAEQQRQQQQEARRKQQEEERRQREEAFRQNELRYQNQLQEISRKSELRTKRDAAIMDGLSGIVSLIQRNKAERDLEDDTKKRLSQLNEYEKKLAEGGYELINCPHCKLDGFDRCARCKNKGSIKCASCNGEAGKRCSNCGGSGKKGYGPYQFACYDCSGTGIRKCLPCSNQGSNICSVCDGRGEVQCNQCEGTGKILGRLNILSKNNTEIQSNETYEGTTNVIDATETESNSLADNKSKSSDVISSENSTRIYQNKLLDTIINKYLFKIGGIDIIKNVRTLKIKYTENNLGMNLKVIETKMVPNKKHLLIKMGEINVSEFLFDGKNGFSSIQGEKEKLNDETLKQLQEDKVIFPQLYYSSKEYQISFITKINIGEEAYQIMVTSPSGNVYIEYYSLNTGLLIRSEKLEDGGPSIEERFDYSNYRNVSNILIPFTTVISVGDVKSTIEVDDVIVNEGVSIADFIEQ